MEIKRQISENPNDLEAHIKLLSHFIKGNNLQDALNHIQDPMMLQLHTKPNSYYAVIAVLKNYSQQLPKNYYYWLQMLIAKERRLFFQITKQMEKSNPPKLEEVLDLLMEMDESLKKSEESAFLLEKEAEKQYVSELLAHYRGQLCLLMAKTIIRIHHKQKCDLSLPLLVLAHSFPYIQRKN